MTDSVEATAGLDPNNPGDLGTDADDDGLTGRRELALGTVDDVQVYLPGFHSTTAVFQ